MRPGVILGTNLAVGGAALAWVLHRHGAAAVALLASRPDAGSLALFAVAVVGALVAYALRWRVVLAGLGADAPLARLTVYRAAGHSVSSIIPSAKLGGEPLRAFLLVRGGAAGSTAIASVAVDRTLEMGSAAACACLYAVLLLRRGVPELQGALVTVSLAAAALALGVFVTVRRLRRGAGLVTAVARVTGLDRLPFVRGRLHVLAAAEDDVMRLLADPRRLVRAFAAGLAANAIVLLEYHLLLAAFGLPASPLAVVAAIFATGAAHSLPIPAAVGALEGAQMWIFGTLGHPADVGLAVGLAVRFRELVWIVPGLVYLAARGIRPLVDVSGRRPETAPARKPA